MAPTHAPTHGPDLSQRRAKAALEAIQVLNANTAIPAKEKESYAAYVKSLPASILMSGLGQALATELASGGKDTGKGQGGKAPNAHRQIYQHLQDWLCGDDAEAVFRKRAGQGAPRPILMECLCTADQQTYLVAQAEALAYLGWLKKFANALLAGSPQPGAG